MRFGHRRIQHPEGWNGVSLAGSTGERRGVSLLVKNETPAGLCRAARPSAVNPFCLLLIKVLATTRSGVIHKCQRPADEGVVPVVTPSRVGM